VNRVLLSVAVVLVVAMAALGVLAGEDEEEAEPAAAGPSLAETTRQLREIASGVERARELEFERLPRVRVVPPSEVRRAGLAELDRNVPRSDQRNEERLLRMLGLLPEDARLREVLGTALAGEVAGYYVPRTDTLALVRGQGVEGFLAEVTLAHELAHALEDQNFGLEADGAGILRERDRAVAESAVHEGSATLVMVDYLTLTQGGLDLPDDVRERLLEQLEGSTLPASSGLPRYVREGLVFPYAAGARFVNRLQAEGGWEAVDRAFGDDAPVSTEQIIHPGKYLAGERPERVRLRGEPPPGARVASRGDLGEFDTAQFLLEANGRVRADEAAAGWGGSAFELWELADGGYVLAAVWAWDRARDAREFARAARRSVERLRASGAVNGGNEGIVAVALAPDAALARRVARAIAP
jgi:hypothetical protein